jgi:hypothetical protein
MKRIKIRLFDISVREMFYKFASALSIIFSFLFVFITIPEEKKIPIAVIFCGFLIIVYVGIWIYANRKKKITLKIRNTRIQVAVGDIFKEDGKKIIPFNEYFDTIVDDVIVAKKSLHGQYIQNMVPNTEEFDNKIVTTLGSGPISRTDKKRALGKTIAYKLGTIYKDNDYWLLAYSKFDKNNKAYLSVQDYAECYMNMWSEVDKYHAGNSVCMPVIGSGGIVRINDNTPQLLLENILWTFRLSGINLGRTATLKIVVHQSMVNDIDFLRLKNLGD